MSRSPSRPTKLPIYGKARIDGVGADVSMSFPISAAAAKAPARATAACACCSTTRRASASASASTRCCPARSARSFRTTRQWQGQHYDLDLRRARVVLPGIGWTKGIGVPATLTFDVKPADDGYAVENLVLQGDGFGFSGSARWTRRYSLHPPTSTGFRSAPATAISLKLTPRQERLRHHRARRRVRPARNDGPRPRSERAGRRLPRHCRRCAHRPADRLQSGRGDERVADAGFGRRRDAEDRLLRASSAATTSQPELRRRAERHDR